MWEKREGGEPVGDRVTKAHGGQLGGQVGGQVERGTGGGTGGWVRWKGDRWGDR